jgi:5'-phosphate synthase pdxT subunit
LPNVGILAIQGDVIEHRHALERIGAETTEIRLPEQLDGVDGLIIPGGESTTIVQLIDIYNLRDVIRNKVKSGLPTWGTCAGMILLAERATGQKLGGQALIGGLDVTVNRNYFGRQVDSFEADLHVPALGDAPFHAVFIRAPAITAVAEEVETLATVPGWGDDGEAVIAAVRKGPILATAFHPELTDDPRWHSYFVQMVNENRRRPE